MSELSGDLRDFPLRQMLELIATGSKSGILVITADSLRGSVFFKDGRVIFATTRAGPGKPEDAADRRHPADANEANIVTSVLMRLLRLEEGTFVFQSGVEPMHPTTGDLTVKEVLDSAEKLLSTWSEIEDSISSIHQTFAIRPTSDPGEVVVSAEQWKILAAMGSGRSAAEIASVAALPEFDVASAMADLADRKLITPVELEPEDAEPDAEELVSEGEGPAPETSGSPEPSEIEALELAHVVGEPSLAERYEYYVNSRGAELREPPAEEPAVLLDLTDGAMELLEATAVHDEPPAEPSSELARRWRDLQRGTLDLDEE